MLSDFGGSRMLKTALLGLLVLTTAIPGGAALQNIGSGLGNRVSPHMHSRLLLRTLRRVDHPPALRLIGIRFHGPLADALQTE